MEYEIRLSEAQKAIFLDTTERFVAAVKGRRFGITHGGAKITILWLIQGYRCLWGDTIHANIEKYVTRYFMPELKALPKDSWHWNNQKKELRVFDGICDFRSAEKPDNWEGFAYDRIILNEAGIILKDKRLFQETVLPMLIDYPNSRLFALGTPKGKYISSGEEHPFFTLWQKGMNGEAGYKSFQFSTYANPYIDPANIDEMKNSMPSRVAQQEIYAQFLEKSANAWAFSYSDTCLDDLEFMPQNQLLVAFDFNVANMACIVGQHTARGLNILRDFKLENASIVQVCERILATYPNNPILMITGDASGYARQNSGRGLKTNYDFIRETLRIGKAQLKAPKSNPSLEISYVFVNNILEKGLIKIDRNKCPNLIADLNNCEADEKFKIKKDTANRSHWLDAFRYLLHTFAPKI